MPSSEVSNETLGRENVAFPGGELVERDIGDVSHGVSPCLGLTLSGMPLPARSRARRHTGKLGVPR